MPAPRELVLPVSRVQRGGRVSARLLGTGAVCGAKAALTCKALRGLSLRCQLAQPKALQLSRFSAWERFNDFDRARVLVRRDHLLDKRLHVGAKLGAV